MSARMRKILPMVLLTIAFTIILPTYSDPHAVARPNPRPRPNPRK